jgi:hypothetical protein
MRYFDEIAKKAQGLSEKNRGVKDDDILSIWLEAERIVMTRQKELKETMQ